MMIGLVPPSTGEIWFRGQPVKAGHWRCIRERMGYVIQDGGLFPHLTARSNVLLMAHQLRWPKARQEDRLMELAELTHFPRTRFVDTQPSFPADRSNAWRSCVLSCSILTLSCSMSLSALSIRDPIRSAVGAASDLSVA